MSPEERAREIADKNCNGLGWAHRRKIEPAIASALAQARAEAFAEALRAVSTLDGYSAELERAHAAIREKAKPS